MGFPQTQRVVYARNTLEEVKCQIRFPPILAIEASPPASFQDALRSEFPYFELKSAVKVPTGIPSNIAEIVQRDFSLVGSKSYAFTTEDRTWTVELSRDGLLLSCRKYHRWEQFRGYLVRAIESLMQIYRPSFFMHTCVRYKNSVRQSQLDDVKGMAWAELLQPWVTGLLHTPEVANEIHAMQNRYVIRLPNGVGSLEANFSLGVHQPSNESAFIIESHVFHDAKKELAHAIQRIDELHTQASLFFSWCITPELHRAMRPSPA